MNPKLICLALCLMTHVVQADVFHSKDRVYIDNESLDISSCADEFYIHTGENIWIMANTIQRDATGLFVYEHHILKEKQGEYKKKWKCPYCHQYWPIGTACGNPECPSRY